MGGRPSKGTKADKRLKENKGKKRAVATSHATRPSSTLVGASTSGSVKRV